MSGEESPDAGIPDPPPAPLSAGARRAVALECVLASSGILLALGAIKHLANVWPWFQSNPYLSYGTVGAAVQLYVPILLIGRRGVSHETLGLSLRPWRRDLRAFLVLATMTVVPFGLGHHVWQVIVHGRQFHPTLAPGIAMSVLTQVFLVALPEELFYRGYLQERLERLWPGKAKLFGASVGAALVAQALVFALAHFVGEYRLDRLGPFFPALLFGWLRARSGSIVGAIAYHAFCNLLSAALFACYGPP